MKKNIYTANLYKWNKKHFLNNTDLLFLIMCVSSGILEKRVRRMFFFTFELIYFYHFFSDSIKYFFYYVSYNKYTLSKKVLMSNLRLYLLKGLWQKYFHVNSGYSF